MVAKARQPLFGILAHDGNKATVEKTAIGWALVHQQQRMLELCPEVKILADKVMPDLFRLHRETGLCGLQFTSLGNHFLSDWPDRQLVEMSRSADNKTIAARQKEVVPSAIVSWLSTRLHVCLSSDET